MKKLIDVVHNRAGHWVGDGFPVRSLFSYQNGDPKSVSPFLLFDYAGPWTFEPNAGSPRLPRQGPSRRVHQKTRRGSSARTSKH